MITSQQQREALVALYDATDGSNWTNNSGWLDSLGTECSWYGVTCVDNSVTVLNLHNNQLSGSIPIEIGNLANLRNLNLYNNQITGSIPSELGFLSYLEFMDVRVNQLSGVVPLAILENTALNFLSDDNAGLILWEGWRSPYNGVTPDPEMNVEFNNIGVFNSDDQLIYACLRVVTNGFQDSFNGVGKWGVAFEIVSLDEGVIRIYNSREFNTGNALNENLESPDCSGTFETTTNIYTDTIEAGLEYLCSVF